MTKTDGKNAVAVACAICSYEFHDPNEMPEHMKTHDNSTGDKDLSLSSGIAKNGFVHQTQPSEKNSKLQTDVVPNFTCDMCGYRTNTKPDLENHMLVHTDRKPHRCPVCQQSYCTANALKQHIRIHVRYKKQCPLCEFSSKSKRNLINHVIEHIQEKPYSCTVCNFSCLKIRELWEHIRVHKRRFVCPTCQNAFTRNSYLTKHMKNFCKGQSRTSSVQEFTCDICNFKTKTISRLKIHMVKHSVETPFTCDICNKKFKSEHNLKMHKLIHMEVKRFSCEMCQLSFSTSQSCKWHRMQVHTGERPFKCDKCPASFVRKDSYKNHMEITHSTDRPFACSKCTYTSKSLKVLQAHERTHIEERSFVCSMCPRAFKGSTELKNHILKIHEKFKPHVCPEEGCDFRTSKLKHLKMHALTHSALKLFHCNICDFKTTKLSGLYQHKLSHTDRKLHKCPVCQKSCRTIIALKQHIHIHVSCEKQCPLCEFSSESKHDLINHLIEHIQEKPYSCTVCNFSCLKIREFWEHKRVHKRRFVCPTCQNAFTRNSYLTKHMKNFCKSQSRTSSVQEFTCDICNFKTKTISRLKIHMVKHSVETPFTCDMCNKKFKSEHNLKMHKLIHMEVKRFSCEACQLSFSTSQSCKWHRMQVHTGERPFKCDKCPASFVRKDSYKNHMEITHSTDRPFACSKCTYTSKRLKGLQSHERTHIEERSFVCSMCPRAFKGSTELKNHILKIHEGFKPHACPEEGCDFRTSKLKHLKMHALIHSALKLFHCNKCDFKTTRLTGLYQHKLIHTDKKLHKCPVCQQSCRTIIALKQHIRIHVSYKKQCPLCEFSSESKHDLINHLIEHIQEKLYHCKFCSFSCLKIREFWEHRQVHKRPFVCPVCQYAFSHNKNLTRHLKTCKDRSRISSVQKLTCDLCNFKTKTMSRLKIHMVKHSVETPFTCDICNKKFKGDINLKQHKLIHLEVKPYSCDTCQLSFSQPRAYKWHKMQVHTGERPFKCDKCPASFVRKDSYKNHMEVTHSTDRPFACSSCSYRCKRSKELLAHEQIHTEERKFVCSMCPRAFKQAAVLKNHILKIHERSKPHACPEEGCDYRTSNLEHLETHALTHSDLKVFQCNKCDFKTTKLKGLYNHKLVHTDRQLRKCPLCKISCRTPRYLRRHIHTHLSNRSQCPLCEFTSESEFTLVEHVVEHTPEMPYHCKFCSFSCLKIRELWEHKRIHKRPFVCPICHSTWPKKYDLTRHMKSNCKDRSKTNGVQTFTCDICDYKTKTMFRLKTHMVKHSVEKPFTCDICNGKFRTESFLKQHKATHLEIKPFSCEACQLSFGKPQAYKWHRMQVHTGERPFKCDKCPASFVRRDSYEKHMKITHSTDRPFLFFKCSHTGKSLKDLQAHEQTHTEERSFVCSMCPQAFKGSTELKNHILKIHEGAKSHALLKESCDNRISNLRHLKTHALTNSASKLFHCNKCDFKTTRLTGLYQHKLIHIDTKLHKCPLCQISCSTSSCLKQHIQSHLGNKTQCPLCEHVSNLNSELVMHVFNHAQEKTNSSADVNSGENFGPGGEIDMPDNHDDVNSSPPRDDTHDTVYLNLEDISGSCTSSVIDADQPLSNHSISFPEIEGEMRKCVKAAPESQRTVTNHLHKAQEKTYNCDLCDFSCAVFQRFKEHKLSHSHSKENAVIPSVSQSTFKSKDSLEQNEEIDTQADKTFICHICTYKTNKKKRLKEHMIVHLPERPFVCDICNKAFKRKSHLKDHKVTHMNVKPFSCEICQVSFSNYRTYKSHKMEIHHGTQDRELSPSTNPPLTCSQYSYSGKTIHCLKRHQAIEAEKRSYICSMCPRSFNQLRALKSHFLKIHEGIMPHTCPKEDCQYRAANLKQLNTHLLTHSGLKVFDCSKCDYKTTKLKCLHMHMKSHMDGNQLRCPICQHFFRILSDLKRHVGLHLRGKSQCSLCQFASESESDLIMHVLEHANERPYNCNFCSFSCLSRVQFWEHKLVHKGESPFVCRICKRAFKRRKLLSEHLLFHIDEKPYKCDLCGQGFKMIRTIKRHCLAHLTEKSYDCFICSHRCKDASELKNHKRWHRRHRSVQFGCNGKQAQVRRRQSEDLQGQTQDLPCHISEYTNHELDLDHHMLQQHTEGLFTCVKCPYKTHNLNEFWAHMKEKYDSNKSNMIVTDHEDLNDSSQISHSSSESGGADYENSQPDEDFEIVIEKDECVEDDSLFQGAIVPNCGNPQSQTNSDGNSYQNEDWKLLENSACPSIHTKETGSWNVNKSLTDVTDNEESCYSPYGFQSQIEGCSSAKNSHSGEDCKTIIKKEECAEDAFGCQEITNQSLHQPGAENHDFGHHPEVKNHYFNHFSWAENQSSDHHSQAKIHITYHPWEKHQNHYPWAENQNCDQYSQTGICTSEEQSQTGDGPGRNIMKSDQFAENAFDCQEVIDPNFHNSMTEIHNSDENFYRGEDYRVTVNPTYSRTCVTNNCSPIKSPLSSPAHEESQDSLHLSGENHNSNANSQLSEDHKVIIVKEEIDKDGHDRHETVIIS